MGSTEDDWRELAECRGAAKDEPDLFFPPDQGGTRAVRLAQRAKSICARCDVKRQCLDYAIEHNEHFGIWGEMGRNERRSEKRRRLKLVSA